jgi:hypothetical protein
MKMFDFRQLPAMAVMLFSLCVLVPGHAHAFDLTGAWATQADLCKLVFEKKGNEIVFAELSDLYGSGFIVSGDRIRGKAAQCTIKSRKQEGDDLELSSACASTIMTSSVKFGLKIIDDNNISRMIPEVPGMSLKYTRCTL